jgi:exonuclease SbcC
VRPVRLELEGFGAFSARTVVDFEGADLFAFTGPTGAGKSTLVDAMVFALYGSVPRYGDRRLVAPAISQGATEARVRFDFTVDDVTYVAARVVRRTKTGATTKEARLETVAGELLAGNEKELGHAVERLLGLEYDHFCKCVVLPQGRFAEFLHDKPEARQELLVELLDLGVYREMGKAARLRAAESSARAAALAGRLAALAWATPERREALSADIDRLAALAAEIEVEHPVIERLGRERSEADAEAAACGQRSSALGRVRTPDGVAALATALTEAAEVAASAKVDEERAEQATADAERRVTAGPRRNALEETRRRLELRNGHLAQQEKGRRVRAEMKDRADGAAERLARTERAAVDAEERLLAAQRSHLAHAVADQLAVGRPCPVCLQKVTVVPARDVPEDLDAAKQAQRDARRDVDRARAEHQSAERELHTVEATMASIERQLADLDDLIGVDPADVERRLAEVDAAESTLEAARRAEQAARKAWRTAEQHAQELRGRETAARTDFDKVRDRLSALAPTLATPLPDRAGDLAADWDELSVWAEKESAGQATQSAVLQRRAGELAEEQRRRLAGMEERCAGCGIVIDLASVASGRSPRDLVVDRLARSEAERTRLDEAADEARTLTAEVGLAREGGEVAAELGRHLAATGFERWLLDEALAVLVEGATDVLFGLSGGQYSLAVDPRSRNFAVVDHRNADQPRPARTLSGGETFLASLALALALADQLTLLAARGGARLESIFLDEGFGSLDPATLDVVASAIEELGAQGRMVGLISHVAELAERVPVRFVVDKVGTSASVERIDH